MDIGGWDEIMDELEVGKNFPFLISMSNISSISKTAFF